MKKIFLTTVVALFSIGAGASDWQFAGYTKGDNNKVDRVLYFDNEFISHLPNSVLRVWIKSLKNSRVSALMMDGKLGKQYVDAAFEKVGSGYIPKYLQFNESNALPTDDALSITAVELIGQHTVLDDKTTMQVQIDCLNMRHKLNLLTVYDEVGNQSQNTKDEHYKKIDSSAPIYKLAKMICAK